MNGGEADGPVAPSGRIICQRDDGIGGRLLTLLWTLRLARKLDAGVLMFWPKLDSFYEGSSVGELFDLYRLASPPLRDRLQIVDGDCRRFMRRKEVWLARRKVHDPRSFVVPVDADPWGQELPVVIGDWEGPVLMGGESAQEALAEMPSVFADLPIRRGLLEHVHWVAKRRRLFRMVAVHIRRGDIVGNLREAVAGFRLDDPATRDLLKFRIGTFARRCMSVENFADALREFVDQGRTILVFSDEPGVHEELGRALGTPNVVAAASLVPHKFTAMQQAFVETCLMSRCRCIVGARSAYSLLAHVIGGKRRIQLTELSRTVEDCAAFALQSVADELLAHPERTQIERDIRDEIVRMRVQEPLVVSGA